MAADKADCFKALVEWEKKHHTDVFRWILHRSALTDSKDVEILDFSLDCCIFSQLLADKVGAKRLRAAIRSKDQPPIHELQIKTPFEKAPVDIAGEKYDSVAALGKFDLVVLKEMLYNIHDLVKFFETLKACFKSEEHSKIFIITRPKNPPVPIPDVAMVTWRKLAPSREELIKAAEQAGFKHDCYSASCPIRVEKTEWAKILYSRSIPAVRFCEKCTDKEIRDFIDSRPASRQMAFEEKVLIIVLWMKGDRPEESDLVANKDDPKVAGK